MSVLAKVREGNNYGGNAPAGTLLEVEDGECERVPWCLERVGDPSAWLAAAAQAKAEADAAAKAPKSKKQK